MCTPHSTGHPRILQPAPRSTASNLADTYISLVSMISCTVPDSQAVCAVKGEIASPIPACYVTKLLGAVILLQDQLHLTSIESHALLRSYSWYDVSGGWLAAASVILFVGKGIHWGIVNRCRSCKTCRGYGIKRCNLCGASGAISWTGKWNHIEP